MVCPNSMHNKVFAFSTFPGKVVGTDTLSWKKVGHTNCRQLNSICMVSIKALIASWKGKPCDSLGHLPFGKDIDISLQGNEYLHSIIYTHHISVGSKSHSNLIFTNLNSLTDHLSPALYFSEGHAQEVS